MEGSSCAGAYGDTLGLCDGVGAFAACAGAVSEGTPALEHDFQVTRLDEERLFVAQVVTDSGGQPYPWGSHLGVVRVGNALLAIANTTEETASDEAISRWRATNGKIA